MAFQAKFDSVGYLARVEFRPPRRGGYKNRKFAPDEVRLLRSEYARGVPQLTLAIRFSVSQATISKIVRGLRYPSL